MEDGKAMQQNMGHVWDVKHAVPPGANVCSNKRMIQAQSPYLPGIVMESKSTCKLVVSTPVQ